MFILSLLLLAFAFGGLWLVIDSTISGKITRWPI